MEKRPISIVALALMACILASATMGTIEASALTIIELDPEMSEQSIGDIFTVDVNVVDVAGCWGMQFVLRWDPSILQVVEVEAVEGPLFWGGGIAWTVGEEWTGVPTVYEGYDCDVHPDGVLDIEDFYVLRLAYGSKPGFPGWNPRADINNDNEVNLGDLWLLNCGWFGTYIPMPGAIQFVHTSTNPEFVGSAAVATITFETVEFGETVLDLDNTKLGSSIPYEARDGTVTVPIHPVETTEYLITTIESWNLPQGTESSLNSKLEVAIDLLNRENDVGAVHKLGDFINRVEAMRGKKLTHGEADYLAARAQAIIEVILE